MRKILLFACIGLSVLIAPTNIQGQDCTINTPDGTVLTCAVMQLVLQANPHDNGFTYSWTDSGGNEISTDVSANVDQAGTYTLTVIGEGTSCTDSIIIEENEAPPNASIAHSGPLCQGGTITLMASGGATYRWDDATTNPNRIVSSSGTYTVTVTGSNGCEHIESISIVEVLPPTVSITGNEPLCERGHLTLQAFCNLSDVSYEWEKQEEGGNWTPTGTNSDSLLTDTIERKTTYRVTVRESRCGFEASDTVTVDVLSQPNPSIEGPTEACMGQRVVYSVKDDPGFFRLGTVEWQIAGGNIDTFFTDKGAAVVTWNNDGDGELKVKVVLGSCMDTASLPVTLSNSATTANADAKIVPYEFNNILIANDPSATCYQWGYYDPTEAEVVELPGETYQAYAPGEAYLPIRNYFVKTWNGDCSVPSCANVIYFLAPIISEPTVEARLQLYPNPNTGLFLFQAEGLKEQPYQLRVADVMGRTLWENTVTASGGKIEEAVMLKECITGFHTLLIVSEKGDWQKSLPFLLHNQ